MQFGLAGDISDVVVIPVADFLRPVVVLHAGIDGVVRDIIECALDVQKHRCGVPLPVNRTFYLVY